MLPQEWDEWHIQIRKTYQYIQMKIKLFFIYEELDNAISTTFKELMNFPRCPEEYFPKHYFDVLLKFLTIEQKQKYIDQQRKLNYNMDLWQFKIIRSQILSNESASSLEVDDLKKVCILKVIKERDHALRISTS